MQHPLHRQVRRVDGAAGGLLEGLDAHGSGCRGRLVPAVGRALDKGGALSAGAVVAIFVVLGLALPSEEIRREIAQFCSPRRVVDFDEQHPPAQ